MSKDDFQKQHYLIIVESPSKCEKIKKFLVSTEKYKNCTVVATCGHFRELKSVCPKTFDMKFIVSPKSKKYINQIKKLATQKNTEVILATDWDREGEAIAFHICQVLKLPMTKTKRIRFGEITRKVILEALENPYVIDKNLVHAQMTRQIIDRWIGFHFSPILWKQFPKYRGLSAGRCQTPTLKIIHDQEERRKHSIPETKFQVFADFRKQCFVLNHDFSTEKESISFLRQNISHAHCVKSVSSKTVFDYPSLPFSTSSLQKYCNSAFGWSPSLTMSKAQKLYEQGHITYHRTESHQISCSFQKEMLQFLEETYGKEYCDDKKEVTTSLKSTKDLPHEAIRVTSVDSFVDNDPLYMAIRKRSLQSVMSKAVFHEQTISISSPESNYCFQRKRRENVFKGFLVVSTSVKGQTDEDALEWKIGEMVSMDALEMKEVLVQSLKHCSEGFVVSQLEQLGIGRPSTFSSFVSKIQEKNYVEKLTKSIPTGIMLTEVYYDKKTGTFPKKENEFILEEKSKLFMTELGTRVVQYLYETFPKYFEFDYTASLESDLDSIAKGTKKHKSLLQKVYQEIYEK